MGVVLRKLYVWVAISIVLIAGCARGNAEPVVRVGTNPSFAPASYKNDKREDFFKIILVFYQLSS